MVDLKKLCTGLSVLNGGTSLWRHTNRAPKSLLCRFLAERATTPWNAPPVKQEGRRLGLPSGNGGNRKRVKLERGATGDHAAGTHMVPYDGASAGTGAGAGAGAGAVGGGATTQALSQVQHERQMQQMQHDQQMQQM